MTINVMEYLDSTAAKYPAKTAFASEDAALTFAELRNCARGLAARLNADGLYREPVVIFMEKSPHAIAASFAAVYAGCFYATVDREMPRHRIEMIFENLRPRAVVCDGNTREFLPKLPNDCRVYKYGVVAPLDERAESALAEIRERAIDLDPVYIVFTSGSTGVPKGVTACHRAVIDYIENLCEVLEVDENTVFGNQAPLYVDACLKEVYTSIKTGASARLIPKELFMFPVKLVEYLNEHKINTICWVSSALSLIAGFKTFDKVAPAHLRTVAFGSELFPVKNLNIWRRALPQAKFINLYGPTEATGMSCYYRVEREFGEQERIPIGKPFRNTEIVLLDKDESGVGEICIRGTCLALGYYNEPEKTAKSFAQNPSVAAYPSPLYRTGDLGGYNERGELMFHSRKDFQIKHMGYRIELPEIEIALCRNESIALACCIYDSEKSKIVLFCTGGLTQAEVAAYAKENLPRYMLPSRICVLEEMPLTPNGKIDRAKLKEMYDNES